MRSDDILCQGSCQANRCIEDHPPEITDIIQWENISHIYEFQAIVIDIDPGDSVEQVDFQNSLTGEIFSSYGPDFLYVWNATSFGSGNVTINAFAFDGELWGWYHETFPYTG